MRPDFRKSKSAAKDIVAGGGVAADADGDKGRDVAMAAQAVAPLALKAAYVGMTGGGCRPVWVLTGPAVLAAQGETLGAVTAVSWQLAKRLAGGDVSNGDRIPRLPGTINWPTARGGCADASPRFPASQRSWGPAGASRSREGRGPPAAQQAGRGRETRVEAMLPGSLVGAAECVLGPDAQPSGRRNRRFLQMRSQDVVKPAGCSVSSGQRVKLRTSLPSGSSRCGGCRFLSSRQCQFPPDTELMTS